MRKSFFNINENLNVTGNISGNSIFGIVYLNINQGREFSFKGFLDDIYDYVNNTHGDAQEAIGLADDAMEAASVANGIGSGAVADVGIVTAALVVTNGILTTTNGVVAGLTTSVGSLGTAVSTLETNVGTLTTKTAYMTTLTTPSIRIQFTGDLTV